MSERVSNKSLSLDQRVEMATVWLRNALDLARSANIHEAGQVISFFNNESNALVGEPLSINGKPAISGKTSAGIVSFVPLVKEDRDIHPYFADVYDKNAAVYKEGIRTVFIDSDELSDFWGSILTIHEGTHALAHVKNWWRDKPEDWSHWYEEYQVYAVELKLLSAKGGNEYRKLVKEQSREIETLAKHGGFTRKDIFSTKPSQDMLTVLPIHHSLKEEGMLRAAFNLQAYFYYLDQSFEPPQNITKHVAFVRWLHKGAEKGLQIPSLLNEEVA